MTLTEYPDVIQRSPEWFELRCGLVTASTIGALITLDAPDPTTVTCPTCAVKSGPCISIARKRPTPLKNVHPTRTVAASHKPPALKVADNDTSRGLIHTLAAERIRRMGEDLPTTSDMWRGIDSEPYAREAYERHAGVEVVEIGFQIREVDGARLGYSPDGLVGTDGLIEIKAPRAKTHIATILADEVPAQYMPQLQAALFVSGRAWIDFVSFSGGLHLYPKRVYPDARWQAVIRDAVLAAEARITDLTDRYAKAVEGLPLTQPIPDPNEVELKL